MLSKMILHAISIVALVSLCQNVRNPVNIFEGYIERKMFGLLSYFLQTLTLKTLHMEESGLIPISFL